MVEYILGVDGGGTATQVRICDKKGKIISEHEEGSGNYKNVGVKKAKVNITRAVLKTLDKIEQKNKVFFKSACFGLSGLDCEKDLEIYREMIFNEQLNKYLNIHKTIICNDSRIGLAAGSKAKNAIMIICGTGSNCYGINEKEVEARVNGWDYILGDEGSGFIIGMKALKAVMRAYDGRSQYTLLLKTILEYLNLDNATDLIGWTYANPFTADRIASIAEIVCRTAEIGDRESIKILKEEAEEALLSICTVARKLELKGKKFDLVFVGKVFNCDKYFKQVLTRNLIKKFPMVSFKPLTEKPVSGAIKIAFKNIKCL